MKETLLCLLLIITGCVGLLACVIFIAEWHYNKHNKTHDFKPFDKED